MIGNMNFDISNITELIIILLAYSTFETVKWYRKKAAACKRSIKMERQIKRLEYIVARYRFPEKEDYVKCLFGEYKGLGGNSYIDEIHAEYLIERKEVKQLNTKKNEKRN